MSCCHVRLIYLFIGCFFFQSASAQFRTTIGGTLGGERCYGVGIDSARNVYIHAYTGSMINFPDTTITGIPVDESNSIIKVDSSGNFTWFRSFDWIASSIDLFEVDPNGHSYIAGNFREKIRIGSDSITGVPGWDHYFVLSFDKDGVFRWMRGSSLKGTYHSTINSLFITKDKKVLVSGNTGWEVTVGNDTIKKGGFIAMYDDSGTVLWTKKEDVDEIGADNAGNIYTLRQNIIQKLDYNRVLLWELTELNLIREMEVGGNGDVFVWLENDSLKKYDTNKSLVWATLIDSAQNLSLNEVNDFAYVRTDEQRLLIEKRTTDNHLVGRSPFGKRARNDLTLYSAEVKKIRMTEHRLYFGGVAFADPVAVPEGLVFGNDTVHGYGNDDIYISSVDDQTLSVVGIFDRSFDYGEELQVYPNPFEESITIRLNNLPDRDTRAIVEVYNMKGSQELSKKIRINSEVNLSKLEQGIYFLIISLDDRQYIQKVMKL